MILPENIPDFRTIRLSMGLTLEDVSEKTKISKSTLQTLETGSTKSPTYENVSILNNYYFHLLNRETPATEQ
jgi:transcriptional regulator with XRE-family HTH domain